uniref:Uncharacterized protein n=1 Tax=Anguilla anguilla TaxID=7936 RepID=A0A0E9WKQ1_ANGAN
MYMRCTRLHKSLIHALEKLFSKTMWAVL